jgi:hypothetical protein
MAEVGLSLVSFRPAAPPFARDLVGEWIGRTRRAASDVRDLGAVLVTFLGARLIVSFVALVAYVLVPANPLFRVPIPFSESPLIDGWIRGDALSYLAASSARLWSETFATFGGTRPLPLFPFLIGAFRSLGGSASIGSLALGSAALLLAAFAMDRLITPRFGRAVTTGSALLALLFPFGFRLATAEPFAFELLFALVAFLGIESNRPWLTATAAAFAALTHPLGLAIWPASLVAQLVRPSPSSGGWRRTFGFLSLAVTPGVVAAYAAILHWTNGLPFQEIARSLLGMPGFPLTSAVGTSDGPPLAMILVVNLLAGGVVALTTPRVVATIGWPYAVYQVSLLALTGAVNPSGLGSAANLAFPGFVIVAAWLLKHRLAEGLWITLSCVGLGVTTAAFVQGYPITGASALPPLTSSQKALASFHVRVILEEPRVQSLPRDLYATADGTFLFLGYGSIESHYAPGQAVPISLYLYTLQTPDQGYLISARLHDRQGLERARLDKILWGSADDVLFVPPVDRTLVARRYVRETLDLPLDPALSPGTYVLDVQLFRIPSFAVVPVVGEDNQSTDRILQKELLVAGPRDLATSGDLAIPRPGDAHLGDAIGFLGSDVPPPGSDRTLAVALYWRANARPAWDYTVFVQALDDQGRLVAQSDSYPWSGGLPTTTWQPRWTIRDVHQLRLPPDSSLGRIHLIAGMYRLETLQRLPVWSSGASSPADHLDLGEVALP